MSLPNSFDPVIQFLASHGPLCLIAALAIAVSILAAWLFTTRRRLARYERCHDSMSQRMASLEKSMEQLGIERDASERLLVAAATAPDSAEGKALAELRREVAVEAINRLEVMRLNRNESALWDSLLPALDEMIVRQVPAIAQRISRYAGEEIEHLLVDEVVKRFHSVAEDQRADIWITLRPLFDAIIIKLASELSDSADYALREKLSEDLVDQVHARLTIAKAVGQRDPLWQKVEPVFEAVIVEAADSLSPREVSDELEPLLAGWLLEMAGSRQDVVQAAVTARLGRFVEEIVENSKDLIKAKASTMVEDAMGRSIDSQISQACLASRRYVNALVMAAIPRIVNDTIQDKSGEVHKSVRGSLDEARGSAKDHR